MKILSRDEMKQLKGGDSNYSCCIEYTNGTTETVTVCADSSMHAKASAMSGHANSYNATCTPAALP